MEQSNLSPSGEHSRRTRLVNPLRAALVLCAAAIVLAGCYGGVRWAHERQIQRRLAMLEPLIVKHAQATHLEPHLVRAVVRAESGGDVAARSKRGAVGLMQLMPIAQKELCRRGAPDGDLLNGDYNLMLGTRYLRMMLDRFGDVRLAVAAYNMGPSRLEQLRRDNPQASIEQLEAIMPPETQRYVRNVVGHLE